MTKTMTRKKAPEKKRTPFRAPMKKPRFPKPRDPNPLTAQIKAAEGDFQGAFAAIDRAEAPTEKLQKALADAGIDEPSMGSKDNATAAISALCAEYGAWAVRVHDVEKSRDAVAIGNAWRAFANV